MAIKKCYLGQIFNSLRVVYNIFHICYVSATLSSRLFDSSMFVFFWMVRKSEIDAIPGFRY
jgi:hypothetical protein